MAQLVKTPRYIAEAMEFKSGEDFKAYSVRSEKKFKELKDASDSLADGQVVGALLFFAYADSYAIYRVVSEKPLKLQHIPYGDAWHVGDVMIRGLRLEDVQAMVSRERNLRLLFKQRAGQK